MNIAIFVWNFPPGPASGSEYQAQAWAERLSENHRVTVITAELPGAPTVEMRDGFVVRRLKRLSLAKWLDGRPRTLLRSVVPQQLRGLRLTLFGQREIRRHLTAIERRPDVLLCFGTPAIIASSAGRRLGIPTVVWIRSEAEYQLNSRYMRRTYPKIWARADGVFVQSEIGKADLLAELQRVSPLQLAAVKDKIEVIGNGVDLPDLVPWTAGGPVLSVGRLIPAKGMDVVIEACAKVGRPLVIAGRGPERAALEDLASALCVNVRFVGFVDRDALAELYHSTSVVVLASHHEGLPNVLLEAMAHGRPVVATTVGGIPDLIADDVNGQLVPPQDPIALAAALDRLFKEPDTSARLAAAARATAEGFSWGILQHKLETALTRWAPP